MLLPAEWGFSDGLMNIVISLLCPVSSALCFFFLPQREFSAATRFFFQTFHLRFYECRCSSHPGLNVPKHWLLLIISWTIDSYVLRKGQTVPRQSDHFWTGFLERTEAEVKIESTYNRLIIDSKLNRLKVQSYNFVLECSYFNYPPNILYYSLYLLCIIEKKSIVLNMNHVKNIFFFTPLLHIAFAFAYLSAVQAPL